MPCVFIHPNSPYWIAKFRTETGRITCQSTKIENKQRNRARAFGIALEWDAAGRKAARGELTRTAALETLARMVTASTGELLNDPTARQHFTAWLAQFTKPGTVARYKPVIHRFLASLGVRADRPLRGVTTLDVTRYLDIEREKGLSEASCVLAVKILKGAFRSAIKRGLLTFDPAGDVKPGEGSESEERFPFKPEQIRRLLAVANEEWRGMVLLGALAGLRINDAASLTWEAIDLAGRKLTFTPQKTRKSRKALTIALHPDLLTYLEERASDDDPRAALFPSLHGSKTGSAGGLSNTFARLMQTAEITVPKGLAKRGKGRQFALLSFHSLRHAFVSALANADVSQDVRKSVAGHTSDKAHSAYTHLEIETQRRALDRLPSLTCSVISPDVS